MHLWDAALKRHKQETEERWVRGFTTTRDALYAIERAKSGKRPDDPKYVTESRKATAKSKSKTTDTISQLRALELLYPDRVQIGDDDPAFSMSANGRRG